MLVRQLVMMFVSCVITIVKQGATMYVSLVTKVVKVVTYASLVILVVNFVIYVKVVMPANLVTLPAILLVTLVTEVVTTDVMVRKVVLFAMVCVTISTQQ